MIEVKRFDYENGIAYKLKEIPDDSGGFGAKLPWKDYLNEKTIAYIKVVDESTILFYWYGFYDQKAKQREITDCDFVQDSGKKEVVLKKCAEKIT